MVGDPLGREAGLEERLQAVVLGGIHADEHRPRQLEREDHVGGGDTAKFGGVGAEVAADGVHVLRRGHRPVTRLLRKLVHPLGPVNGTLAAQPLEELVRRAIGPRLAIDDQDVLEIAAYRRHRTSPIVAVHGYYWLDGQE